MMSFKLNTYNHMAGVHGGYSFLVNCHCDKLTRCLHTYTHYILYINIFHPQSMRFFLLVYYAFMIYAVAPTCQDDLWVTSSIS